MDADIPGILRNAKTRAVVGISEKPDRPSYGVASYLMEKGYRIVPVNPNLREWRGIKAYPDLRAIPKDVRVDAVDIFRKSGDVPPVVDGAIAIGAKTVWMQLGIVNEAAADKARKTGIQVVMDRCMKIERMKMKD
ncbi:CoA-binding protein [Candidatus Micrarchaeota archaeon]|nr:CoA-binding protein [Candidatus Micrarchaeota archaeon]